MTSPQSILFLHFQVTNPKVDKLVSALNKSVGLILDVSKKIELWDQPHSDLFKNLGLENIPSSFNLNTESSGSGEL